MNSNVKWFGLATGMFGLAIMLGGIAGILAEFAGYSGYFLRVVFWGLLLTGASAIFLWAHSSGLVDIFSKAWTRVVSG